jgi:adenylate cyclase
MRQWFIQRAKVWTVTCICIFLAWSTTKLLASHGALRVPTFIVYDALLNHRSAAPSAQSTQANCVIVGLEERDIQLWGQYPISDATMSDLLDRILAAKPAAVGLDIYRDLPQGDHRRPGQSDADHQRLGQIFSQNDNVVAPQLIGSEPKYEVSPPAILKDSPAQVGITDVKADADDVLRRALLYEDDRHGNSRYSLALLVAARMFPDGAPWGPSDDGKQFQLGKTIYRNFRQTDGPYVNAELETPKGFQIIVDYRGPREFPEVCASDVLSGKVPAAFFAGKVVLIGTWTFSVKDLVDTPIQSPAFGVTFHATVADQLIRAARAAGPPGDSGAPLRQWSAATQNAWLALFCAVGAAIAWGVRPPGRYFAGIVGMSMVGVATAFVLAGLAAVIIGGFQSNLWIPAISPLVGFLIGATLVTVYSSVSGRLDRRAMMTLFSWCVAEDIAKEIWSNRESIFARGELKPRRMRATLLFTDLVGFSRRAEGVDPEITMQWLKEYFEEIARLVIEERGNINKFNGDQIVAVFGPPVEHNSAQAAEDAQNAVRCALRMRERLAVLNDRWGRDRPETRMRVGIHSGWVVAGSLGTRGRIEWTVIGNDVNIAARLESTSKSKMSDDVAPGGCRILISQRTLELTSNAFETSRFGVLRLKGLSRRVRVHAVKGESASKDALPMTADRSQLRSPRPPVESS